LFNNITGVFVAWLQAFLIYKLMEVIYYFTKRVGNFGKNESEGVEV
jgi:hypothetical protein